MTEIGTFIVNAVTMYGLPFACAILFIGSLGAPFPCTIIVILLGAFVRDGILNPYIASSLALVSCVSGDLIIYGLGRMGRSWIPRRIQFSAKWINVENAFNRHAGIAVYMTRWFMTPLAFPTTLIAGNGACMYQSNMNHHHVP